MGHKIEKILDGLWVNLTKNAKRSIFFLMKMSQRHLNDPYNFEIKCPVL